MHRRTWTDPRDGSEWTITYQPGVELSRPDDRRIRNRLILESGDERLHAEPIYGDRLEELTDGDLKGLLDQARRREAGGRETAWGDEEDAPGG